MARIVLSLILFFSFRVFAESELQTDDSLNAESAKILLGTPQITYVDLPVEKTTSSERREASRFIGLANYSPLDLVIPSKIGLTAGYIQSVNTTWEIEYLRGSFGLPFLGENIGAMTDQRLSIIRRSFVGKNSFNFSYGVTFFDYSVNLGSAILSRVTQTLPAGFDVLQSQTLGFNIGFGNRWTFGKNITFGIDWLSLSQPLFQLKRKSDISVYLNDPNDKENVDTIIRIASYFPRLAAIKLQLGMSF